MNKPTTEEMLFYLDKAKEMLNLGNNDLDVWYPALKAALLDHDALLAENERLRQELDSTICAEQALSEALAKYAKAEPVLKAIREADFELVNGKLTADDEQIRESMRDILAACMKFREEDKP